MSGTIHGCGADFGQYCRRCRIPHPATEAQGARNTTITMSPATKHGCLCPSYSQFRVSGFRVHGDPADARCYSHNTCRNPTAFGRLGRIVDEYRPRGLHVYGGITGGTIWRLGFLPSGSRQLCSLSIRAAVTLRVAHDSHRCAPFSRFPRERSLCRSRAYTSVPSPVAVRWSLCREA